MNLRSSALVTAIVLGTTAFLGIASISCGNNLPPKAAEPVADGPQIGSPSVLAPDVSPGPAANLVLGGLEVAVKVEYARKGDKVILNLAAHGETLETEVYEAQPAAFLFLENSPGEVFAPGIPLLKFPMKVGETWEWTGTMTSGLSRPAKAQIATANDKINTASGPAEALMVTVTLHMDTTQPVPAERKLRFWFLPSKGLVQREFGSGSTRMLPAR